MMAEMETPLTEVSLESYVNAEPKGHANINLISQRMN